MPSTEDAVSQAISRMPIAQHLQLLIEQVSVERTVFSMPVTPSITFDGRTCQGGIVATLADFAAVAAAYAGVVDGGKLVATTAIHTHLLKPALGSRLVAVGRLIGPAARTMVCAADVFVEDPDGVHCATGTFIATAISGPAQV